jgi:hypothetical protein
MSNDLKILSLSYKTHFPHKKSSSFHKFTVSFPLCNSPLRTSVSCLKGKVVREGLYHDILSYLYRSVNAYQNLELLNLVDLEIRKF